MRSLAFFKGFVVVKIVKDSGSVYMVVSNRSIKNLSSIFDVFICFKRVLLNLVGAITPHTSVQSLWVA